MRKLNIASILLTIAFLFCWAWQADASEVTGRLTTGLSSTVGEEVVGTVITAPVASPAAGTYSGTQSVALSAAGSTSIRYTADGAVPTCTSGTVYAAPISVSATVTIKAIACYPQDKSSAVTSMLYTIQTGGGGGGGGSAAPASMPQGRVLGESLVSSHPNGTLVLDGNTIYLIKAGKLWGFRDPEEYKSHGYKFAQTVVISEADKLLQVATGTVKALEGTLVLDASDNRTVYMVGLNGTKRGFASEAVFRTLGYSFANLPKINLVDYVPGPAISSANEAHPEGALVLDDTTVWWVREGKRMGFESEAVFNTYGFSSARAVAANAADLALPAGSLVKLRDGTLVKDGADYYIISDGLKLKFKALQTLKDKGYKEANVVNASLSGYTPGVSIE